MRGLDPFFALQHPPREKKEEKRVKALTDREEIVFETDLVNVAVPYVAQFVDMTKTHNIHVKVGTPKSKEAVRIIVRTPQEEKAPEDTRVPMTSADLAELADLRVRVNSLEDDAKIAERAIDQLTAECEQKTARIVELERSGK